MRLTKYIRSRSPCSEIRYILDPNGYNHEVSAGQPFYLGAMNTLLLEAGDVDAPFMDNLAEALPRGVNENTFATPGIWPTKMEIQGEDDQEPLPHLPDLVAFESYSSAVALMQDVKKRFEEEPMGLVSGPHTKSEAARICECKEGEPFTGEMGAIVEKDMIRTIFGGTLSGVNEWIQRNTIENYSTWSSRCNAFHWMLS